jgi:hypothetical protein
MKNFKNSKYYAIAFFIVSLFTLSCSKDDSDTNGQPPVINKVSAAVNASGQPSDLSPTNIGFANNTYIIQGSGFSTLQKVYFNDTDTSFNPNFVTDTSIFVTIDIKTPYANVSSKLKLVTKYGVVEYDFVVAPPAPQISSYTPINTAAGNEFTIYGGFFLNPVVTVGTTPATIISSTLTQIRVRMPAGSQYKLVTVTTVSGSATATQPVGTAIYDDERASFVENYLGPWDGSGFTVNTEIKSQGTSSIKAVLAGYVGFKFPMFATPASTTGYRGLRISLKSTKETGKFKVVLNGNYGSGKEVTFNSKWSSVVIPFSELGGAPATINEIVLQEFGNDGGDTIYIDDVGFVLN